MYSYNVGNRHRKKQSNERLRNTRDRFLKTNEIRQTGFVTTAERECSKRLTDEKYVRCGIRNERVETDSGKRLRHSLGRVARRRHVHRFYNKEILRDANRFICRRNTRLKKQTNSDTSRFFLRALQGASRFSFVKRPRSGNE